MLKKSITFDVAPGIGDISWIYSKILDLAPRCHVRFKICGDLPRRSFDFVSLLPGITNAGYGGFYRNMVKRIVPYKTDLLSLAPGTYALSMNPHLEAGRRIELAYPRQTTWHHYRIQTTDQHRAFAAAAVDHTLPGARLGFYCSSHKHRPKKGFWSARQWVEFLLKVNEAVPNATFIAIGAEYDDKTVEAYNMLVAALGPDKVRSSIGASAVGSTLETLRRLDYFFAFPSGLAVFCDVLKTPCMMAYWSNIEFPNFPKSYAAPESLATQRHLIVPYLEPDKIFSMFEKAGPGWIHQRMKDRGAVWQ